MITKKFEYPSRIDKKHIFAVRHEPENHSPKAVIIISHGMGEYKERYLPFSSYLCSQGFAVYQSDQRGHGETAALDNSFGVWADEDGWFAAVEDLLQLYNIADTDYPNTPIVLFGHSLGSFLAITFAIKWGKLLKGVILSGTGYPSQLALKSGKAAISAAAATFGQDRSLFMINALCFAGYALSVKKPKTEFDWICSDPKVVAEFISNPRSHFLYSNGFFLDLIKGLNYNFKPENLEFIPHSLPFYFISGADDPVGDHTRGVKKTIHLLKKNGVSDISMQFYEGMRHEILNERIKDRVYKDLNHWINLHI